MALVSGSAIIAASADETTGLQSYHRVLRAVGMGTWAFLGLPILDSSTHRGYALTHWQWLTWLSFFLLFGPAFWYSSDPSKRPCIELATERG